MLRKIRSLIMAFFPAVTIPKETVYMGYPVYGWKPEY